MSGRSNGAVNFAGNETAKAIVEGEAKNYPGSHPDVARVLAEQYSRIFRSFLSSTECVERISCEINRVARSYKAERITKV